MRTVPVLVCLVMASEEAHRFYPTLGTLYLERIGEMVATALQRVLSATAAANSQHNH
jgi:uncharacterized protein YigA (DUF484 family)